MLIQPNTEIVRATWFACKCFGVTAEECELTREEIHRAIKEGDKAELIEQQLARQLEQVWMAPRAPIAFSWARNFFDSSIPECLRLYRRLSRALDMPRKGDLPLRWLLIDKVWLPTFVAILDRGSVHEQAPPTGA